MGKDNIFICGNTRERYMTIEIAPQEYFKELNYYDSLLYCQLLNIDGKNNWRMIKNYHEFSIVCPNIRRAIWVVEDGNVDDDSVWSLEFDTFWVIPVRDI